MSGNVTAFAIFSDAKDTTGPKGGLAATQRRIDADSESVSISTGVLPAWLGFTATTRQNDIDTSITISFQPDTGGNAGTTDWWYHAGNWQAFLTFGDKSWGSVKVGKDMGIFASTAGMNDMTTIRCGCNRRYCG